MQINEIKREISNRSALGSAEYLAGHIAMRDFAMGLLNQLDEPQKPVVPGFVDEYMKENEGEHAADIFSTEWLYEEPNVLEEKVAKWLLNDETEENNRRYLIAVQAFVTGDYEVEKEPLWRIKNKEGNHLTKCALWGTDGVNYSFECNSSYQLLFTDKAIADAAALLVNGTVEEVAEG